MEVAEAEMRGGAMASKGVEVSASHQNQLGHTKCRGAAGQRSHVMSLRHVVHHYEALRRRLHHHKKGSLRVEGKKTVEEPFRSF